jgi:hypothetical protein
MDGYPSSPLYRSAMSAEVAALVEEGRKLVPAREDLRQRGVTGPELEVAERALDRLHWRLAEVTCRCPTDELGNAA